MKLVLDTESDGFVEEATVIWCIVAKDIEINKVYKFGPDKIKEGLRLLESADELICHNLIAHDLMLIKKLYPFFNPKGLIIDTMLLSQLLQPDRAGGHSLEAAGELQGRFKPEHEDWSQFSEEMLHRCSEDVEINHWWYEQLMKEAYEPVQGIPYKEIFR